MAQREGTVYLTLFIVAMVLFVVACVAFFFVYNESEETKGNLARERAQLKSEKDSNETLNAEITRLKTLIAGSEEDVGSKTQADLDLFRDDTLKKAQAAVTAAYTDLGQAAPDYGYLTEPYADIEKIARSYQELRDGFANDAKVADERYTANVKSTDETIETLNQEIAQLRSEKADAESKFESCTALRTTEKEQFTQQLVECQEESTDLEIAGHRRERTKDNKIASITTRLERLEREARSQDQFAQLEPDGRLFRVARSLHKGWVDLGRRDHLMTGLVFEVFQIVKGGKKVHKGRVDIRKVDEEFAEVRVLEEVDPSNPITDGDHIASPFYDRREKPIFVLAGSQLESKDVTIEFLQAKLRSYGVDLRKQVDINTTYLVALEDYQQTPVYNTARELGVPVLRELDVLKFIGY